MPRPSKTRRRLQLRPRIDVTGHGRDGKQAKQAKQAANWLHSFEASGIVWNIDYRRTLVQQLNFLYTIMLDPHQNTRAKLGYCRFFATKLLYNNIPTQLATQNPTATLYPYL